MNMVFTTTFFFFSLACLNICHIIKILLPLYIQITTKKLPSMPRTGFPLVPLTTFLQIRKYKNNDYKHIYKHGHMKLCGNNKLQSGSHLYTYSLDYWKFFNYHRVYAEKLFSKIHPRTPTGDTTLQYDCRGIFENILHHIIKYPF